MKEGCVYNMDRISTKLVSLLQKMSEHDIILPVLADVLEGQLREKNIEISTMRLRAPYGVDYDIDKNKIYISAMHIESLLQSSVIRRFFKYVQNKAKILSDASYVNSLTKSNLGVLICCLLYYGMHVFNRYQRGQLIAGVETKKWYLEFLYRNIYNYENNQLTTISRLASTMLYYPYMWLIYEQFEIPMYNNVYFSEKTINKIIGVFANYNGSEVVPYLTKNNIDQPTLDLYDEWFGNFLGDLKRLFYSQTKRMPVINQEILNDNDVVSLTMDALERAYGSINTTRDVLQYRYPVPLFREMFVTSEPLAQSIFATYLDGKISGYEDWQKMSARGLSLLG